MCLLVMYFVEDNGDKKVLLKVIYSKFKKLSNLYIVDLMCLEIIFECEF